MKIGEGTVAASCDASQLTVVISIPSLDGWLAARNVAEDIATIVVGALGFSLGSGYWVELIQAIEEDGTAHVFGVRPGDPASSSTLAIEPQIAIFNRALRLAARNVFFRLALRDYLRAINDVGDCASYCYRAIEGIKSAIAFKTKDAGWDEMHTLLGTDEATIRLTVKSFADPIRHGNWIDAPNTDKFIRWRMLSLTQSILCKYLDHEQPTI
jgi:hypothetical protein